METNEILMLVGLILVGYFLLKFIWNMVGNLIKLAIVLILVVVGVHFVRPDLLGEHDAKVTNLLDSGEKAIKEGVDKVGNMVEEDSLVKKGEEKLKDSVTSK